MRSEESIRARTIDDAIEMLERLRDDHTAEFILSVTSKVQQLSSDVDSHSHVIAWCSKAFMLNTYLAIRVEVLDFR